MSFPSVPITIAEEKPASPLPAPSSFSSSNTSSSSFRSFDVRLWEGIHLQSLTSTISSREDGAHLKITDGRGMKSHSKHPEGFSSFPSSPYTSMSERSSPYWSSDASSHALGYPPSVATTTKSQSTVVVASPVAAMQRHKLSENDLPVVKAIQTGSMIFTSDGIVLQQPTDVFRGPRKRNTIEAIKTCTPESDKSVVVSTTLSGMAKISQVSGPATNSSPIPPIKPAGSIPFKWEEVPGKPKPCVGASQSESQILPALQLPPKLLYSSLPSASSCCSSPSSQFSHPKHAINCSPRNSADKVSSARAIWNSLSRKSYRENGVRARLIVGEGDSLSSPTSTLIGPNIGFSSESSSSSSTKDAMCQSPDQLPEVQSSAVMTSLASSRSLHEPSPYVGAEIPNLAPSMERKAEHPPRHTATDRLRSLLKSCQIWSSLGAHRKRNHEEAEMWAPTLATYYYSLELERNSSISGQSLLGDANCCESAEPCRNNGKWTPPSEVPNLYAPSSIDMVAHDEVSAPEGLACLNPKEDNMFFSAAPSRGVKHSIMGRKGKNVKVRRKAGGWVLRKLRNSSKILAAMMRAFAKKGGANRSTASSKKWKRRRSLPYHHIRSIEEF